MAIAYIEIERDGAWKGKGNINLIPKGEYWAIMHGHGGGKLDRTVFMVDTAQENIDKVKASHEDVKTYVTKEAMQIRGLAIKPGTPTIAEVNILVSTLKNKYNIDLKTLQNTSASKSWRAYLIENVDHIGKRNVKCLVCSTVNINVLLPGGDVRCTNCNALLFQPGNFKAHSDTFNIDEWTK